MSRFSSDDEAEQKFEQTLNNIYEKMRDLRLEYANALNSGDSGEARRIAAILQKMQILKEDLIIQDMDSFIAQIDRLNQQIEDLTQDILAWPFGSSEAPVNHEKPNRGVVPENDYLDQGPDQPEPDNTTPTRPDTIPVVSEGWSENYLELWNTATITNQWQRKANAIAKRIIRNQNRYSNAVANTQIPWWFVAIVHSMECSLRFDQHLHNGDSLRGYTVRIPKGRPPSGVPPFRWEDSAADAIKYDKVDKITDWSLASALYHWHRYNGINNAYKRNGIPTPYLWSGTQHYIKGKYVKDGVFNPDVPSKQVGAAVLLKTLIQMGAVQLSHDTALSNNPAAATRDTGSLNLDITNEHFRHLEEELNFSGNMSRSNNNSEQDVKRVQEWLGLHNFYTAIDGDFGPSTERQLRAFQATSEVHPNGIVNSEIWSLLSSPLRKVLSTIDHGSSTSLEEAVLNVARQHIQQKPREIGGNNKGPWVRTYMESDSLPWCAGFVCFVIAQAVRDLKTSLPFRRQVSVDQLVEDAKNSGRFISHNEVSNEIERRSKLHPGMLFVNRRSSTDWHHVGFLTGVEAETFNTLEGNTDSEDRIDGAVAKNRKFTSNIDFIRLI